MAFFGLTYLGPPTMFGNVLHTRNINHFSDKTLMAAFEETESANGKGTISIDEIRSLLSKVYGNSLPPEREIRLFTKYCDLFQRGPQLPGEGSEAGILIRVNATEFKKVVEQVRKEVEESDEFRKIAGNEELAHEFKSYDYQQEHRHKHHRSQYNPQDKYVKPVITSQSYGWYTPAKVEQVDRIPNQSCPETLFAAKVFQN